MAGTVGPLRPLPSTDAAPCSALFLSPTAPDLTVLCRELVWRGLLGGGAALLVLGRRHRQRWIGGSRQYGGTVRTSLHRRIIMSRRAFLGTARPVRHTIAEPRCTLLLY